ncbi:hypothetical protein ABH904_001845 [Pseudomonas frederiksbergensis]
MYRLRVVVVCAFTLAAFMTLPMSSAELPMAGHISVLPSDLKWSDAPSVAPGAQIVVIEGDLKTADPFTFRLKLPANSKIGVHTHPVVERVTVISGTFHLGSGDRNFRHFSPRSLTPPKPGPTRRAVSRSCLLVCQCMCLPKKKLSCRSMGPARGVSIFSTPRMTPGRSDLIYLVFRPSRRRMGEHARLPHSTRRDANLNSCGLVLRR